MTGQHRKHFIWGVCSPESRQHGFITSERENYRITVNNRCKKPNPILACVMGHYHKNERSLNFTSDETGLHYVRRATYFRLMG